MSYCHAYNKELYEYECNVLLSSDICLSDNYKNRCYWNGNIQQNIKLFAYILFVYIHSTFNYMK